MKLNSGEIHIWSTTIDERFGSLLNHSYLSVNEKRNAAKYAYDIDTYLFSIRHNLLRIILGGYLNCNPAKIKFNSNHYQKPHIAHPNTLIQFNISASSNRFLAAFCQQNTIGVDIELIRPVDNLQQMISDYFTKKESDLFHSLPNDQMLKTFFQIWSKKEALVKAIGKGLNIDLKKIDVLADTTIVNGDSFWYLHELNLFDDCAGAIATNHAEFNLSYYNISDLL